MMKETYTITEIKEVFTADQEKKIRRIIIEQEKKQVRQTIYNTQFCF